MGSCVKYRSKNSNFISTGFVKFQKEEFLNAIYEQINDRYLDAFNSSIGPIRHKVAFVIEDQLLSCDTIKELSDGDLRHSFGLTRDKAAAAIVDIISYMSSNISLSLIGRSKKNSLTLTLDMLPIDSKFINSVSNGVIESEGGFVTWLNWLLTKGTQVVIGDFGEITLPGVHGRSGGNTVMVELRGSVVRPFRVDPDHAGTANDNFITRAIEPVRPKIMDIVTKEVLKALK